MKQVTVFLENTKGRLAALCRTLANAGVNMSALTVADTASYGVARILADDPNKAADALAQAGYRAKLVEVSAVGIPNVPGSLARLLDGLETAEYNLEYAYCFASGKDEVIVIIRVEDATGIAELVERQGYRLLHAASLDS
jgi:hypothetical protein